MFTNPLEIVKIRLQVAGEIAGMHALINKYQRWVNGRQIDILSS